VSEQDNAFVPYRPGAGAYVLACTLGAVTALALATWWLDSSPIWLALLLGTVSAALGAASGENIGDALIFSLIVAVLVFAIVGLAPELGWLRSGVVPLATGLCVGKLVVGIGKEAFG
jgi:hypothetical protein